MKTGSNDIVVKCLRHMPVAAAYVFSNKNACDRNGITSAGLPTATHRPSSSCDSCATVGHKISFWCGQWHSVTFRWRVCCCLVFFSFFIRFLETVGAINLTIYLLHSYSNEVVYILWACVYVCRVITVALSGAWMNLWL